MQIKTKKDFTTLVKSRLTVTVLFSDCWVCFASYLQEFGSTCFSRSALCLMSQTQPRRSVHTFQELTFPEVRIAALGHQVNEGGHIESAALLT